ncbi:hypothetical protein G3A43_09390 [Paraburkholderia aspalathi]|nr:hypothetical protein [Paraburkholderia aspalathi]MBK3780439.1 hypothetical protein [Paraburkholderia aspalathi]
MSLSVSVRRQASESYTADAQFIGFCPGYALRHEYRALQPFLNTHFVLALMGTQKRIDRQEIAMSNTPHTLGFTITEAVHTAEPFSAEGSQPEGRQYRSIQVRPLVDGQQLVEGYVFDALTVIAHGCRSADVDLFTCSCGISGCAGIFDDARIEVSETLVSWTFPEEPFREKFNPGLFPVGAPLTVCFEREHYASAVAGLEQALLGMSIDGGLPVSLAPDFLPDLDDPLSKQFNAARTKVNEALHAWLPQAAIDAAVDLFSQFEQFVSLPEAKAKCRRQVEDIRTLMQSAAKQAPGTCHGFHTLKESIRRPGESDDDVLFALLELVSYLTGAHGPYELDFQHAGRSLQHVRKTLDGWDVRDDNGVQLALDEVFIILRRRDKLRHVVLDLPVAPGISD